MTAKKIIFSSCLMVLLVMAQETQAQSNRRKIDSVRQKTNTVRTDSILCKAWFTLAYYYSDLSPDSTLIYIDSALKYGKDVPLLCSKSWNLKASAYYSMSRYEPMLSCLKKAEHFGKRSKNHQQLGYTYTYYGSYYHVNGKRDLGLKYNLMAIDHFRLARDTVNWSMSLIDVSESFTKAGDLDKGLKWLDKADHLLKSVKKNNALQAYLYSSYGKYYNASKQYSKSIHYLKQAVEINRQIEYTANLGWDLSHLGQTYTQLYDSTQNKVYADSALFYLLQAYPICLRMDPVNAISVQNSLAHLYSLQGHFKKALEVGTQALKIATSEKLIFDQLNIYSTLCEAYAGIKRYDSAFYYQNIYFELKDSLYGNQALADVKEVEAKYLLDKQAVAQKAILDRQEAEKSHQKTVLVTVMIAMVLFVIIATLAVLAYRRSVRSKKIIAEQQVKLQQSLEEKEALLREIHHRVKNNLQVISGLLNLQSADTNNEEVKAIMSEGQSRVKSMALIHQMLYQNENLNDIPFQEYLIKLTGEIASNYHHLQKKVQIHIDAGQARFDVDVAVPLGLIINELVSNSFKYAFKHTGNSIDIQVRQLEKNSFSLVVRDNGEGLPAGFDLKKSKSLGLRLVNLLCKQIRAELSFDSQEGARFNIQFKDNWKTGIA